MDLETRARKITQWLWDRGYSPAIGFEELVIAQLREVEREAHDHGWSVCKDCYEVNQDGEDKGEHIGFLKAREKAAGIVEETEAAIKRCQEVGITGDMEPLAERIRGMQP